VGAELIWSLLTDALSYTAPEVVHLTLMVIVGWAPLARVPSTQRTVEETNVQPDEADTNVAPAGSALVTTTLVAVSGPLLVTVML
jgi:hypothetical protein